LESQYSIKLLRMDKALTAAKETAGRLKAPRLLEFLHPLSATVCPLEVNLSAERGQGVRWETPRLSNMTECRVA
jgi:hypothetical protein